MEDWEREVREKIGVAVRSKFKNCAFGDCSQNGTTRRILLLGALIFTSLLSIGAAICGDQLASWMYQNPQLTLREFRDFANSVYAEVSAVQKSADLLNKDMDAAYRRIWLNAVVSNENAVIASNNLPDAPLIIGEKWTLNRMPKYVQLTPEQRASIQLEAESAKRGCADKGCHCGCR